MLNSSTKNCQEQRKFSSSLFSYDQKPPDVDLVNYINPDSEKAHQALLMHKHREWSGLQRYECSYKTVMCQKWLEKAECPFGKACRFAHGIEDLRPPVVPLPINSKYKTRLCSMYTYRGVCPYGSRCLFIHPEPESKLPISALSPASPQHVNVNHKIKPLMGLPASPFRASRATGAPHNNADLGFASSLGAPPPIPVASSTARYFASSSFHRFAPAPIPSPRFPRKKWSDLDDFDHDREMERIVDRLVSSPMISSSSSKKKGSEERR